MGELWQDIFCIFASLGPRVIGDQEKKIAIIDLSPFALYLMLACGVAYVNEEKSSDKAKCPVGKSDGVVIMDISRQLLMNGGDIGFVGTMIIVAVPEQHILSGAS